MHGDDFDRHTKEHDTPSLGGGELHEQITIGCVQFHVQEVYFKAPFD
jgi:hypothetical protein